MVILGRGFVRPILKLNPEEDSDDVVLPILIPCLEEVLLPWVPLLVARLSSQETCGKTKFSYDTGWCDCFTCTCTLYI